MEHVRLIDRVDTLSALERNAQGWKERALSAGERLFEKGDPASALYLILDGRIAVLVDDATIDELGRGECLGEASAFFPSERRQAAAIARSACRLLVLQRSRINDLRASGGPTYDWLLEAAMTEIWARLERRDREIVAIGGERLAPPAPRGRLSNLWQRLRGTGSKLPDNMLALGRVAGLEATTAPILETIAVALTAHQVPSGRALFLQGEEERDLHLLAEGRLAIVREDADGEPHELIVLEPGALFGAGGFIAAGPRTASAVARTDCWVLSLSREGAEALPTRARRSLYEAVLATLRSQLRAANTLMTELGAPGGATRAVGHLQGWQPHDPLAEVSPVDLVEH